MNDTLSPSDATAKNLVDTDQFPIDQLDRPHGKAFAERCRREYTESGLCLLTNFVRPSALSLLTDEAEHLQKDAFFCRSTHDAYLSSQDAQNQEQTFVGSVPYDKIPDHSLLNKLYQWDPLKDFIGHVLGKKSFYRFADPFGACSINVFVDGGKHGWHFDESEYTVTLMLQKPEQGGAFEYVPCIRGLPDEKTIVSDVLNGAREQVTELPFTAGTLLIFGGRQTLHRVTKVSGNKSRLVPVLCFSENPEVVNSESVRKMFWGRTGPDDVGTSQAST